MLPSQDLNRIAPYEEFECGVCRASFGCRGISKLDRIQEAEKAGWSFCAYAPDQPVSILCQACQKLSVEKRRARIAEEAKEDGAE